MTIGATATYGPDAYGLEADKAPRYSINEKGEITAQEGLYKRANDTKRRRPISNNVPIQEGAHARAKRRRPDEGRGFVSSPGPPSQEGSHARAKRQRCGQEDSEDSDTGSETEDDGWDESCVSQRGFVLSLWDDRYALGIEGDNGYYHHLRRIPTPLLGAQPSDLIESLKIPEVLKQAFLAEAREWARKYPDTQPALCVYVDETLPDIAAIPYTNQPRY